MGSKPSTVQETQMRSSSAPNVKKSHQNGVSPSGPDTDTSSSSRNPPKSAAPVGRKPPSYHSRQIPPPKPPKTLKEDIFSEEKYKFVDDYVLNAPPKLLMGSFKELIRYLTAEEDWDDLAKARAIFRWVTAIDVYSLRVDSDPPAHSPLEYFTKIQKNQGNHAHLVSGLCQMAGLPCVIISGMNKSAAYEIGKKCERKQMGAQWNAVFIKDDWRFLDAFWASACVVGKKSSDWTLVDNDGNVTQEEEEEESEGETQHRVNEFYFLPNPDQLIWTHFPDEQDWQLLVKPISVKDYESHVYVRERFYYLGINFTPKSETKCVLTAKDGEISLPFTLPAEESEFYRFKYMLYKNKSAGGEDTGADVNLDRFVLFEHTADSLRFALRFPLAGKFKMDIFGLDVRHSDIFDLTCTYLIHCPEAQKNCLPLPDCPPIGWGFGGDAKNAGLEAKSHDGAIIITKDGKVEIKLGAHKDIRLHQLLKNTIVDEATLSKYAVIREENGEFIVDIRLPQGGEYAMKLYANEDGEDGEAGNVLNYLIKCNEKNLTNKPFPNVTDGFIGKKSIADALGVKALSHKEGKIHSKDGKLKLEFQAKNNMELVCELHSNDPNATKHMKVYPKEVNGKWIFDVDMPIEGEYSVNVFAKKKGDGNKRIYNVHSYMIQSDGHALEDGEDNESKTGDDSKEEIKVVTETVQTSEKEILIPVPKGFDNVVACLHRRHADDLPNAQEMEFMEQDGMKLFKATFDEYGEYIMDLYQKDENGQVKNIARYQVNRKPASELYQDDARLLMEQLQSDMQQNRDDEQRMQDEANQELGALKKDIQKAMDLKNPEMLERSIAAFEATNPPENDKMLQKAKRLLELLRAKEELNTASHSRDLEQLDKAIKRAKEANYDSLLDLQIVMAGRLRDQLHRIEKLRHSVLNMDKRTVSEIRNYGNPPDGVHQSIQAACLLLGHTKKEVKEWKTCQIILGKTGKESIMRHISNFDPKDCYLDVALSSKMLLEPYSLEQIRDVSAGAATFFVWAKGMIEEVEATGGAERPDDKMKDKTTTKKGKSTPGSKKKKK
ncbi:uncharacterized protein LOC125669562 isoform X3 [Ostrea edulis]|uniref:uncharacterized protein LOC125669562 isoform X3 n=1 Tax=Ostrea edulis TaxID=37623 RepID=UPI002095D305|nr:uncharacterized protein LOC125669562 isoform X3 [Ostrea edulis]XP_056017166.1 uncharacterized protein LOC125669562 isoform X3 [Ostrea edulis]XP_056017167.1 uncharacterized protein LOC125669562 isoform X3 [Ostrea edulis]XP_056017168.1 uncharacterized protein LOC125669562 isoform X3 [Ostrea edulis]XP_056017169.1 uncharacterized protein LOC125669562 isoform X3 [Ostrea edulis]XP_056017170.1 uncharacterized protein LOC125669562 isoform X3 [Ostrea edulis]XP_056017171.1 uncharacterized protein LO